MSANEQWNNQKICGKIGRNRLQQRIEVIAKFSHSKVH